MPRTATTPRPAWPASPTPATSWSATSASYDGADEVRRYYATTFGAFPDLTLELIAAHHADSAVFVEMWMSGSHLGSRRDFEATGKHFRARAAALFQFQDAALVGARIYYDTGTIARQLA